MTRTLTWLRSLRRGYDGRDLIKRANIDSS